MNPLTALVQHLEIENARLIQENTLLRQQSRQREDWAKNRRTTSKREN